MYELRKLMQGGTGANQHKKEQTGTFCQSAKTGNQVDMQKQHTHRLYQLARASGMLRY
jgi:hypothetical protein